MTDRSSAAEGRASLLAQQLCAEVLYVHALPLSMSRRVRRLNFARAHVQLLSRAERAMAHAPHNARVSVRHGTPVQAITEAACEWQPDLIVMARPRQRPLDLILGTAAERVIRATGRPVLIVNATAAVTTGTLAWRDERLRIVSGGKNCK
jgi:nucleotide-binding universal stress UspA family protein